MSRFQDYMDNAPPLASLDEPNLHRYRRGKTILGDYAGNMYGSREDREDVSMVASDLISDLLHVVQATEGLDPEDVLDRALRSFEGDREDGPYRSV